MCHVRVTGMQKDNNNYYENKCEDDEENEMVMEEDDEVHQSIAGINLSILSGYVNDLPRPISSSGQREEEYCRIMTLMITMTIRRKRRRGGGGEEVGREGGEGEVKRGEVKREEKEGCWPTVGNPGILSLQLLGGEAL